MILMLLMVRASLRMNYVSIKKLGKCSKSASFVINLDKFVARIATPFITVVTNASPKILKTIIRARHVKCFKIDRISKIVQTEKFLRRIIMNIHK